MEAIANEGLPRTFERFNPAAVAANVHNVTVTVLGIFVVAAALATARVNGSPTMFPTSDRDLMIMNPTNKTTYLSYQDHLLTRQTINPGQTIEGLLFFDSGKISTNDWGLSFRPSPSN